MKFALAAYAKLDNKRKQAFLIQAVQGRVANKILWSDASNPIVIAEGESEDKKPAINIILRFESKDDRDEVGLFLKHLIATIPALNGSVKIHLCYHDEKKNQTCEPEQEI